MSTETDDKPDKHVWKDVYGLGKAVNSVATCVFYCFVLFIMARCSGIEVF